MHGWFGSVAGQAPVRAPRYVPLTEADRFVGLPVGVVGGWIATGLVTTTLYVHRGTIIRGVSTLDCWVLCDAIRVRKIARARGLI